MEVQLQDHQERSYYFDNIKGFLIYCVVFAHFLNLSEYPFRMAKILYIFIYFFHMPAFIFVSGFFSKKVEKGRRAAVKKYFVPYVLLTVLTYVHTMLLQGAVTNPFRIFTSGTGCWYLLCLFIYRIFLEDIIQLRYPLVLSILAGMLCGFTSEFGMEFSLQRMAVFLVFYLLGFYTTEETIKKVQKIPKVVSVGIVCAFLCVAYYLSTVKRFKPVLLHCKNYYREDYLTFDLGIRIFVYIAATLLIFALCSLMTKKKCLLTQFGQNSLAVYFLHLFVMRRLDKITTTYQITAPASYVYVIVIAILSFLCVYLCSRAMVMKFILGIINGINRVLFPDKRNFKKGRTVN